MKNTNQPSTNTTDTSNQVKANKYSARQKPAYRGKQHARRGFDTPTLETIKSANPLYTPEDCEEYLTAYNANCGTLQEMRIRHAGFCGYQNAVQNRGTSEEYALKKYGTSQDLIDAFRAGVNKYLASKNKRQPAPIIFSAPSSNIRSEPNAPQASKQFKQNKL